jgi:hypothetical protein
MLAEITKNMKKLEVMMGIKDKALKDYAPVRSMDSLIRLRDKCPDGFWGCDPKSSKYSCPDLKYTTNPLVSDGSGNICFPNQIRGMKRDHGKYTQAFEAIRQGTLNLAKVQHMMTHSAGVDCVVAESYGDATSKEFFCGTVRKSDGSNKCAWNKTDQTCKMIE